MRKYFVCLCFILNILLPVPAQDQHTPPDNPHLIIGIVIEQMRSDYIYRFWDKFGEGGFKRLMNEGTYCRNASLDYFFTQTSAGYATIFTGTSPANHGIVSDEWYDRISNKVVQSVADESVKTIGGTFDAGCYSPRNLLGTTIADEIKLSNFKQSRVFGISLNPESAVLPAGHTANGAFWFDTENGNFVSSSFYAPNLPNWLTEMNEKKLADIYLTNTWEPSFPIEEYTCCLTDENPYEAGIDGRIVFPYSMTELGRNKSIQGRYQMLKQTPFANSLTKDLAIATIVNENLGKSQFTDMLTVSFSATENIGNDFGPLSIELADAFIKLDQDLEHFLNFIDEFAGKHNTLIFVTSNHGAAQTPQYLKDSGIPVGYFNYNSAVTLLRSYLNVIYGSGEWVKGYYGQQLYLNFELIEDSKLELNEFQDVVARFLIQFNGVSGTLTAHSIQTNQFNEGFGSKIQRGFFSRRSGDVFINLYPGWIGKSSGATTHNSSYIYDTHVPLFWYGWKIKREMIIRPVNITDIAPTISLLMNIMPPNASTGTAITEIIK